MDLANLTAWDAQDALLAALRTAANGDVPVDLGFPVNLQPEHVWITGDMDTTAEYDETGSDEPSGEGFTLYVRALVTFGDDFEEARDRLKTVAGYVSTAIASATFLAAVDDARTVAAEVNEGRSGDGRPQVALTAEVACRRW